MATKYAGKGETGTYAGKYKGSKKSKPTKGKTIPMSGMVAKTASRMKKASARAKKY